MKVIRVSPELIADLITSYRDDHPDHLEGKIDLEVSYNSWRAFEKRVGK